MDWATALPPNQFWSVGPVPERYEGRGRRGSYLRPPSKDGVEDRRIDKPLLLQLRLGLLSGRSNANQANDSDGRRSCVAIEALRRSALARHQPHRRYRSLREPCRAPLDSLKILPLSQRSHL